MEEIGLDGVDFKLRTEGNNYTLVFAEIFPDDAGLYKVHFFEFANFLIISRLSLFVTLNLISSDCGYQ